MRLPKLGIYLSTTVISLGLVFAQSDLDVQKAELSAPFGVANGYLMVVDGDFLFVNTDKPETSVRIPEEKIVSKGLSEGVLVVVTSERFRGLNEFRFRVADPSSFDVAASVPASGTTAGPAASPGSEDEIVYSYEVRHDHWPRGGCDGRLVITPTRIRFESLSNVNHSENWRMEDVKEIRRKSTYALVVRPFNGDNYNFSVHQQGVSREEFDYITKQIAQARTNR